MSDTVPDSGTLRQTPLADRHVALGARMIPFAGWLMPVQYAGQIAEHKAVRSAAGLFDLGHMGQVEVEGPDALPFLQWVASSDIASIEPGEAIYGMLPNERGGVIDDILVYRRPDRDGYMVVVNASNRDKDVAHFHAQRDAHPEWDVRVQDVSDDTGMIAIQGPAAPGIVAKLTDDDLDAIGPFRWAQGTIAGTPMMVARTGYTGEDGFEFYTALADAPALWDALLAAGADAGLMPVGLGARDTLRLEARMPLYGNEIGDDISPLEAGLGWAVALDKGPFVGREAIAALKAAGAPRRTVGFRMLERGGAPRHGYPVLVDGRLVGQVTSGAPSPTLGENIGLALIEREAAGVGKPLEIEIRGKTVRAEQVKLPFYRRGAAG